MPITSSFKVPRPPPVPRLPLLLWALRFCPVVLTSCLSGTLRYSPLCCFYLHPGSNRDRFNQCLFTYKVEVHGLSWDSSAKQSWFPWHVWSTCPSLFFPLGLLLVKMVLLLHDVCCCNINTVNKNGRRGYPEIKVVTSMITGCKCPEMSADMLEAVLLCGVNSCRKQCRVTPELNTSGAVSGSEIPYVHFPL